MLLVPDTPLGGGKLNQSERYKLGVSRAVCAVGGLMGVLVSLQIAIWLNHHITNLAIMRAAQVSVVCGSVIGLGCLGYGFSKLMFWATSFDEEAQAANVPQPEKWEIPIIDDTANYNPGHSEEDGYLIPESVRVIRAPKGVTTTLVYGGVETILEPESTE